MQRLFAGLPIPEVIKQELTPLSPAPNAKVRPVSPAQMHLTIQFIGQADAEPIAAALQTIRADAFSLSLSSLGTFGSARRGAVLWAGVQDHPCLTELHNAIGLKLSALGIELESRAFTPHVTVARCRRQTPRGIIEDFLNQSVPPLPPLPVTEFILYSSNTTQDGPVYTREFTFPLESA